MPFFEKTPQGREFAKNMVLKVKATGLNTDCTELGGSSGF